MIPVNLDQWPIEKINETFNAGFADYSLPIQYSLENFEMKVKEERIDLSCSTGLVADNQLVGLILHGRGEFRGEESLWNGGTAIVPEFRGHRGVDLMYSFILPKLRKLGIHNLYLEVLSDNARAIRVYERIGFEKIRSLICYKSENVPFEDVPTHQIVKGEWSPEGNHYGWANYPWAWQHDPKGSGVDTSLFHSYKAIINDLPVGHIVVRSDKNRVVQWAVDPTRTDRDAIAQSLWNAGLEHLSEGIQINNIDVRDEWMDELLAQLQPEKGVAQFEMFKRF